MGVQVKSDSRVYFFKQPAGSDLIHATDDDTRNFSQRPKTAMVCGLRLYVCNQRARTCDGEIRNTNRIHEEKAVEKTTCSAFRTAMKTELIV